MRCVCGLMMIVLLGSGSVFAADRSTSAGIKLNSATGASTASDRIEVQPVKLTAEKASKSAKPVLNDRHNAADVPAIKLSSFNLKLVNTDVVTEKKDVDSSKKNPTPKKQLKPQKRKVLVFKASWCGACLALNNEWPALRKVRWRIGEKDTDHIQLVDVDQYPELMARYQIAALPTLVLIEDGRELSRHGSLGAKSIAEFYYGRLK